MSRRHVGLYCRLSPRPDGSYEGVDLQEKWGRDYAAKTWPTLPVEVFADAGISAANGDVRPEYDRLREWIAAGRLAEVWCVEQSRLERQEIGWFQLAALLDAAGIQAVHTNRDGVVRVHDEVAGIKAVLAAAEVRKIRRRVNDRLDEHAAQGRPSGANTFGYRHSRDESGRTVLEVVPEQADAIRWAADSILSGWSLTGVTRELTRRGHRGALGGALTPSGVRRMITSATIAGRRIHRGVLLPNHGTWEPILAEDVWQAVRLKLSSPRVVSTSTGGEYEIRAAAIGQLRSARRYALTGGLTVCGVCRAPMVGSMKKLRRRSTPYLLCSPSKGGRGCVGIMLEATQKHVADELFAALDRPAFRAALAADEHAERRDQVTRALARLEQRRDDLARMWGAGELTAGEWQTARSALAAQEDAARLELQSIPPPPTVVEGLREAWPDMTLDERREMLRLFIARVTVGRAKPGTKRFDSSRISITWIRR